MAGEILGTGVLIRLIASRIPPAILMRSEGETQLVEIK